MSKKSILIISVFIIALIAFTILANKIFFPDVAQYLGVAKEFAELSASKVRNLPSIVYPLFLGQFLKLIPSLVVMKLLNILWLILSGVLLYNITKDNKTLLLWIFSPLVWYVAPWINPILAVSFFFLLAYYFFIKYEKKNSIKYLIFSGLSIGITGAIWWAATYIIIFFILAFFFKKRFYEFFIFLIAGLITYSIKFLVEYVFYGIPFLSIIRSIGSNLVQGVGQEFSIFSYVIGIVSIILLISIFIYRIEFRKYKRETAFLILSVILFLLNFQFRYYIVILPLTILLISKNIKKKHLLIHIILALLIIPYFTFGYFGETEDYKIIEDLKDIAKDYPGNRFIVGSSLSQEEQAFKLSSLYWGKDIQEFIWFSDYYLSLQNKTDFKEYAISSSPKINDIRKVTFKIIYSRTDNQSYDNVNYQILIDDKDKPLAGFEKVKEYKILRLFKKVA